LVRIGGAARNKTAGIHCVIRKPRNNDDPTHPCERAERGEVAQRSALGAHVARERVDDRLQEEVGALARGRRRAARRGRRARREGRRRGGELARGVVVREEGGGEPRDRLARRRRQRVEARAQRHRLGEEGVERAEGGVARLGVAEEELPRAEREDGDVLQTLVGAARVRVDEQPLVGQQREERRGKGLPPELAAEHEERLGVGGARAEVGREDLVPARVERARGLCCERWVVMVRMGGW
jgi:hypothetical protein